MQSFFWHCWGRATSYRPNLMQSISGWDYYKISFVMSVCLFGEFSCVRKSQASSTKLGTEAQNLKGKVEFVCGTNWI
jgi:hypothetical protein